MNEATRASRRLSKLPTTTWKRRCQVYKYDETCDTDATGVTIARSSRRKAGRCATFVLLPLSTATHVTHVSSARLDLYIRLLFFLSFFFFFLCTSPSRTPVRSRALRDLIVSVPACTTRLDIHKRSSISLRIRKDHSS